MIVVLAWIQLALSIGHCQYSSLTIFHACRCDLCVPISKWLQSNRDTCCLFVRAMEILYNLPSFCVLYVGWLEIETLELISQTRLRLIFLQFQILTWIKWCNILWIKRCKKIQIHYKLTTTNGYFVSNKWIRFIQDFVCVQTELSIISNLIHNLNFKHTIKNIINKLKH